MIFKMAAVLFICLMLCVSGSVVAQDVPAVPPAKVEKTPLTSSVTAPEGARLIFLELFSSENCPFCPQAERNFNDIVQGENVVGYTCLVDYFESGDHSPYAQPFCKAQQDLYVRMMKTGSPYTPQIIINGHTQMSGRLLQKVSDAIRLQEARPLALTISAGMEGGTFAVILPEMKDKQPDEKFVLRVVGIKSNPDVLTTGRLRRDQAPRNVATSFFEGGLWDGKRTIWNARPIPVAGTDGIIVMVQDRATGNVLAAGQFDFTPTQ